MAGTERPQPKVGVWVGQFKGVRSIFWRSSDKDYSPRIFTPRKPEDLSEVQSLVRQLDSDATAGFETAQTEAQRDEIYKNLRKIASQK